MSACDLRMFRCFDLMRIVAIVMGGRLVRVAFSMMMLAREQMLDVAIRSCQQPEHNAARRHDAEADVNFWLP